MTLTHILVFIAAAALYLAVLPARWRGWALFAGSIVAIYWLQPPIRIRSLDFVFPTATLGVTALAWAITRAPEQRWTREDTAAALVMAGLVIALALGRYLAPELRLTPSRPPNTVNVALALVAVAAGLATLARVKDPRRLIVPAILAILALFIVLKTAPLAESAARALRQAAGQSPDLAQATELDWLGFSYVAFRLIHTLRDRQTGKLPPLTLREYVTYTIFFPAYTAGPIDRAERFAPDLRDLPGPQPDRLTQGGARIAVGIAKKFIVADSLALFALNAQTATQADSTGAMWLLLYAYTFQIYFDFSGYTDIAIGIGQLYGIRLPENFNRPYLRRNITLFWQSWHITLSQWVRFYVFSPLSRYLLTRKRKPSPLVLALIGQVTTMVVIGLWHGVSGPFVVWGLWHGLGLFVHKWWSDRTRNLYVALRDRPRAARALEIAGVVLTFHFVALGWVWFALPELGLGWEVVKKLLGI
jgi:alginate O-acetyltransferase complex protein AlgI